MKVYKFETPNYIRARCRIILGFVTIWNWKEFIHWNYMSGDDLLRMEEVLLMKAAFI
jgi:hypothetical protein